MISVSIKSYLFPCLAASSGSVSHRVGRSPLSCTRSAGSGCWEGYMGKPCLGHHSHICPRNSPVEHSLPGCPAPLLLLAQSSHFMALFFQLQRLRSFLVCGFEPHLKCHLPSKSSAAWLHQSNSVLPFHLIDGLLSASHSTTGPWCFGQTGQVTR